MSMCLRTYIIDSLWNVVPCNPLVVLWYSVVYWPFAANGDGQLVLDDQYVGVYPAQSDATGTWLGLADPATDCG
jgi:hypothetical protein